MIKLFQSILLLSLTATSCGIKGSSTNTAPISDNAQIFRIAFGSCSDEDKPQPLWDDILSEDPDVWIWLGDNIYGDSEDMKVLRSKYNMQNANPDYQKLKANATILGTWDDHDYGANDAGRHYPKRVESQKEFLRFFEVPNDDIRWTRPGIYDSRLFNNDGITIQVILLDTRYFRDDPIKEDLTYFPNTTGTILGEDQWQWLEKELSESMADVHIIASGYQIIAEEHRFEKWSNFPNERKRLFDLLKNNKTKNPIIITGDRHIGEIAMISHDDYSIYDITSSSLTHGWSNKRKEPNKHRLGNLVYDENYGLLEIKRENDSIQISVFLKTEGRVALEKRKLEF